MFNCSIKLQEDGAYVKIVSDMGFSFMHLPQKLIYLYIYSRLIKEMCIA